MKQIIAIIAVVIGLFVFFVIIDCNEFSHDNQPVQSESSATKQKPVVSVTGTNPATEVKPMVENKPVETNPIAKTKPVAATKNAEAKAFSDVKPIVETKPAKTNLVTETKSEPNPGPAAVPVVAEEEAKKLNEKAKEYAAAEKEKREPFYSFYQKNKLNTVCFEGTVRTASAIPDPAKNDYDDCLYTLFVEIDSLLSNISPENEVSCEVIVTAPIMKDKKILQDNMFYPGDKIWCSCVEYNSMPQAIQEIQLSDDIQFYEHQQYYSVGIRKISEFQKGGNRNFTKRVITILPVQTLPKDKIASESRNKRIQSEITRIDEELKKHGGSFESWKKEYTPVIEKYKTLSKNNYKGWIKNSYFATGLEDPDPSYDIQAYIDGILPYKKHLEEKNIDLIIVRIPTKWEFARCVLASDVFQDNPAWIEHYYMCLKNDIEIVDPMPSMWEHRFDFPLFYFYNEPTELHPFVGQSFITAKVLSDYLKRYSFTESEHPIVLEDYDLKTNQKRYFLPEGNENYNPKEVIHFKHVIRDNESLGPLSVNTGSPFLFLSNSFFWYPWRDAGASLPAYTAYFIQHVPDWFYQAGIGSPMLRNLISDRKSLSNRKAVIMVGDPDYWNGSFPTIPKYLLDNAKSISLESTLDFLSPDIKILDNGSFLFEKDEDNATTFTQTREIEKPNKFFDIQVTVPSIAEKETCMLRVNFAYDAIITMVISDIKTKEDIDQTTLPTGKNLHADFYIPITDESRQVSIRFTPLDSYQRFAIKNIELWYY